MRLGSNNKYKARHKARHKTSTRRKQDGVDEGIVSLLTVPAVLIKMKDRISLGVCPKIKVSPLNLYFVTFVTLHFCSNPPQQQHVVVVSSSSSAAAALVAEAAAEAAAAVEAAAHRLTAAAEVIAANDRCVATSRKAVLHSAKRLKLAEEALKVAQKEHADAEAALREAEECSKAADKNGRLSKSRTISRRDVVGAEAGGKSTTEVTGTNHHKPASVIMQFNSISTNLTNTNNLHLVNSNYSVLINNKCRCFLFNNFSNIYNSSVKLRFLLEYKEVSLT